jgi:hypothetical protein
MNTYLFLLICTPFISSQVNILNPLDLAETFRQQTNGSKHNHNIDIDFRLGNFGEIPYGKTLVFLS